MKTKTLCYFSQKDIIHDSQLMEIMLKMLFQKTHSLHQAVDPRQTTKSGYRSILKLPFSNLHPYNKKPRFQRLRIRICCCPAFFDCNYLVH